MQPYRKETLPRRNDRCPCGSGKKAKNCCLDKIKVLAALPPRVRQQVVVANILGRMPSIMATLPASGPASIEIVSGTVAEGVPVQGGEMVIRTPEATA